MSIHVTTYPRQSIVLKFPDYPVRPPKPANVRPPRQTLAATGARQRRDLTYAGAGAVLPVAYGQTRCPAILVDAGTAGGDLVVVIAWCHGPIQSIDQITDSHGTPVPAGIAWTHYLGDPAQGVDPTAAAAIPGWNYPMIAPSVTATPSAAAYSVASIPAGTQTDLQFVAQIHGALIHRPLSDGGGFDPTPAWSDNPAECLADFVGSPIYGRGASVNPASARATAIACAEALGDGPRRRIGLLIDRRQTTDAWIETLRAYAGCFVAQLDSDVHLIPDRPGVSSRTITDSHIIADRSGAPRLDLRAESLRSAPTVVRVDYTDTTQPGWPTAHAYAATDSMQSTWLGGLPGDIAAFVQAGGSSAQWAESRVPLPGIQSASQALREAVERLQAQRMARLRVSMITTDESLATTVGDIVTLDSASVPGQITLRVLETQAVEPGRWRLSGVEYSDDIYSNITQPGAPPASVPGTTPGAAPTGLHVDPPQTYLFYDTGTSSTRPRIRFPVTWDLIETHRYQIDLITNEVQTISSIATAVPAEISAWEAQITPGASVRIQVFDITPGSESPPASLTVTSLISALDPPDVTGLSGTAGAGQIHMSWSPVTHPDLDGYEIRRGAPGDAWEIADLIGEVTGTLLDITQPAGTHEYQVRAKTTGGNLSSHAATQTLTVALAPGGEMSDSHRFNFGSATGLHHWRAAGVDHWTNDLTDTWSSLFPGVMNTYAEPLSTYHPAGSAEWLSDVWDIGQRISARWTLDHAIAVLSGNADITVQLSDDAITWTDVDANDAGAGQYVRVRAATTGASTLHIVATGLRVHVSAVVTEETSPAPVTSSATSATVITLASRYVSAVGYPDITPLGSAPVTYSVDNIVTGLGIDNTFEVRLWDSGGQQIAAQFGWHFIGIT